MSAPEPCEFHARPAEIPQTVPLRELADRYHAPGVLLVEQHDGIGVPLSAEVMAGHAVADRVFAGRWVTVRDALSAGAGRERAAAMGAGPDELVEGLLRWADERMLRLLVGGRSR